MIRFPQGPLILASSTNRSVKLATFAQCFARDATAVTCHCCRVQELDWRLALMREGSGQTYNCGV
jgi:hypothetical protein